MAIVRSIKSIKSGDGIANLVAPKGSDKARLRVNIFAYLTCEL